MFAHRIERTNERSGKREIDKEKERKRNYIEKVIKNICHEQNGITITIK